MSIMIIYRLLALALLVILLPVFLILYVIVRLTSPGPFLFVQARMGRERRIFRIYKIRTMVTNADELKSKYLHLNEYKAPLFKMYNDPRYTWIGKFLAHYSIDELPQLINIVCGQMSFIGPRPLPVDEARAISKKYDKRFTVLPGLIPPWFTVGSHALTSEAWLDLDLIYVTHKSAAYDVSVIISSINRILT